MSIGLLALLDDVAALTKVAAASLDDIAGQAAKAGAKAAGVVIDDAAVTPRYVIGFAAARELPIVRRIAVGSLRNKLLILLPAAVALSTFLPWAITPLLMLGGAYLCYEGVEKLWHVLAPHQAQAHEAALDPVTFNPQTLEDEKVASAIKTDFILSAEIMAIAIAVIPPGNPVSQTAVLALVALGITVAVYGVVALIVKADDAGVALARSAGATVGARLARAFGRALVRGMPTFLMLLSAVGTAAMIWVGGGILVHGLEAYGFHAIGAAIHAVADLAREAIPALAGPVEWLVAAAGAGLVGSAIGAGLIPLVGFAIAPCWRWLRRALRRTPSPT